MVMQKTLTCNCCPNVTKKYFLAVAFLVLHLSLRVRSPELLTKFHDLLILLNFIFRHFQVDITSFTHLSEEEQSSLTSNCLDFPEELSKKRDLIEQGFVFPTHRDQVLGLDRTHDCSCLSPHEKNYHEITALNGPAAFIDILAPPYSPYDDENEDAVPPPPDVSDQVAVDVDESRRECDFFKYLSASEMGDGKVVHWLQWVHAPRDYYCDGEQYQGPVIESE